MTVTWARFAGVLLLGAGMCGAGTALAQQVDRNDRSQPSAAEIALASDCRDTYTQMRAVEKQLEENRNEFNVLDTKISKSAQILDELETKFEKLSAKSQAGDKEYEAALKGKKAYEVAAAAHNALIDKKSALLRQRNVFSDSFNIFNPKYVNQCSGTIFKYLSVILACKDETSDWCDLLK